MSAPIHIEGPYRSRRAKRTRWVFALLTGVLLAVPFIAAALGALLEG